MKTTIDQAIDLAVKKFKDEHGKDAKLEDGEEFCTVFNDAVVILGIENRKFSVKILAGKPYFVDFDLDLIEKVEEGEANVG